MPLRLFIVRNNLEYSFSFILLIQHKQMEYISKDFLFFVDAHFITRQLTDYKKKLVK